MEGVDDSNVARHLGNYSDEPNVPAFNIIDKNGRVIGPETNAPNRPAVGILAKEGFPNLVRAIGPEINAPGRLAVGILADANDDPHARWEAIADRLQRKDIELPTNMAPAGTVIDGRPRVGIWLMPDNEAAGELEDFVSRLIPQGDSVWPLAERYIDGIPIGDRKFKASKISRAKIHAWLATRAEPRKMGGAIGAGDLDATAPVAMRFANWLRELFG